MLWGRSSIHEHPRHCAVFFVTRKRKGHRHGGSQMGSPDNATPPSKSRQSACQKKKRGGGWDAYEKLIMHRPHLRWDGSICVERKGPATPLPDKSRLLVHEHQQDQILCM